ncbi:MAG TPA: ATP-binding protein, partial [Bdellovibrionota bacterium]|nr:ATP-binding protein [Bdellovibrionota bacterium]
GIPLESLEKIFLPFYTTKNEGVGLGLALTKQIVSAHHGDLRCDSNPGIGTIFTIELPLSHF